MPWNRITESQEYRKRRVKMIREAQAHGLVLTHPEIDAIFEDEKLREKLAESQRAELETYISEMESELIATQTKLSESEKREKYRKLKDENAEKEALLRVYITDKKRLHTINFWVENSKDALEKILRKAELYQGALEDYANFIEKTIQPLNKKLLDLGNEHNALRLVPYVSEKFKKKVLWVNDNVKLEFGLIHKGKHEPILKVKGKDYFKGTVNEKFIKEYRAYLKKGKLNIPKDLTPAKLYEMSKEENMALSKKMGKFAVCYIHDCLFVFTELKAKFEVLERKRDAEKRKLKEFKKNIEIREGEFGTAEVVYEQVQQQMQRANVDLEGFFKKVEIVRKLDILKKVSE